MDSNPNLNCNFVDLLQSQQDSGIGLESSPIPLFGTQATEDSNFEHDSPVQRKERRSWSQTDDEVTSLGPPLLTYQVMGKGIRGVDEGSPSSVR
ncbi:unnamed protein product [Brassica rapa subsp. narinosa]|uniref:(rape) hypothetical protein n=1 Tax=Brassica napus TaxID=3708 RepID=A0A817ANQ3_BRANA|nr:unnamed protein product [Brassica napus]